MEYLIGLGLIIINVICMIINIKTNLNLKKEIDKLKKEENERN